MPVAISQNLLKSLSDFNRQDYTTAQDFLKYNNQYFYIIQTANI